MANVTDSSSLLVVPSGWSDGVLGSLKPDDGSGDFTFSRGSDLSATRVNEDGYIEKGYGNLIRQSNTLDTSPWPGTTASYTVTGGQVGYDGSNDAWEFNKLGTGNAYYTANHGLPYSISTNTLYLKAGTANGIYIFLGAPYIGINIETGNVWSQRQIIDYSLTDVGNGWKKFVWTYYSSGTGWGFQIAHNDALSAVGTIYIQDIQVNEGISSMPYLETGSTPVYAGISEDQPLIDYLHNQNGVLHIRPERTNIITYSDIEINPTNNTSGYTKGFVNESIFTEGSSRRFIYDASGSSFQYINYGTYNLDLNEDYCISAYFKPVQGSEIFVGTYGSGAGTGFIRVNFDTLTTAVNLPSSLVVITEHDVIPVNDDGWYYVYMVFHQTSGSTCRPCHSYSWDIKVGSTGDEIYVGPYQLEKGSFPTSIVPSYMTATTCPKETATLTKNVAATGTIFININADSAKTLTFLGGNVSVTQGVNKIALAYSPTALKISHNGSIVQNIARSLDTSSLTEIQLGHRNNFEQTTDSINQFLTLDSFLTDTELNELTA